MENIKLTLPISNIPVELKPYITARDKRAIRDILLSSTNINPTGGISGVNTSAINKAEDKTFEIVVLSIGGSMDKILDRIMDLQGQDYDYLLKKVGEITEGLSEEKKS